MTIEYGPKAPPVVSALLNGEIEPHHLPYWAWALYSFGFRDGCSKAQIRVERAEREADYWWVASKWTPKQIADLQLDASLEGKRIDWHRGVLVD